MGKKNKRSSDSKIMEIYDIACVQYMKISGKSMFDFIKRFLQSIINDALYNIYIYVYIFIVVYG